MSTSTWEKKTDASGRTYYFNEATEESRWDNPLQQSSGGWQELTDDNTGRTYYYHPETKQTKWERPDGFPIHPPGAVSGPSVPVPNGPPPNAAAAAAASAPKGTEDRTASESKALLAKTRAQRRESMLPSTTKAAARRSVLAAADAVRSGAATMPGTVPDKAAGAGAAAGSAGAGTAAAAAAPKGGKMTPAMAAQLGRWRHRGRGRHIQGTTLDNAQGIPVRETLQALYKINRDKTLKEFCLFLVWSLLFVSIVFAVNDVHTTFATNDALLDLFLDEEFADANYKKNFHEIYTMGEYWTFLQGPVFEGVYVNEWYNGDVFNETEYGYILNYLRVVGGVQLRQARVGSDSCSERRFLDDCLVDESGTCVPRFDTKDGSCYADFTVGRQDTRPYGPPEDPTRYTWSDGHAELEGLYNFGPDYGTGGYITVLPLNRTDALSNLTQLFDDLWTDQGTRMVLVSMNLYNTNTKLMSTIRILVEFFASGHLVRSFKFFTIKLVVYQSRLDTLRLFGEVVFLLFWLYYLQKEVRTLVYHKPFFLYFTKFRNLFEVLFLGFNLAVIITWLQFVSDPLKANFTVEATEFMDMFPLAERFMTAYTLAGFIGLMACLKVFKFLSISKKMNALWLTLFRAAPDLIAFIVGFVVLVAGFAFLASMTFGFMLVDFHNFLASFSTLLRFPLGDFDYNSLQVARPAITGVFFTCYVGMVFLVCMNMIIGIVTKYFDEVHHELKFSDKWKISTMSLEAHLMQRMSRSCRSCGTSIKRFFRRKCKRGKTAALTDEERAQEDQDQRSKWADKVQADGWAREAAYSKQLHNAMRNAKRKRNIDLYAYFDQVYNNAKPGSSIYIGVHELCHVVERNPCPPSQHLQCMARKVLDAYNQVKHVTIVGQAERHTPRASVIVSRDVKKYSVIKVNRSGMKQARMLVVDTETNCIYNFNKKLALKKQLPLSQLIQMDSSKSDPTRVSLVFTSQGLPFRSQFGDPNAMETTYDLIFEDEDSRNAFIAEVSAARLAASSGSPLDGTTNPMMSRRQLRTEQSALGLSGPRDDPAAVLDDTTEAKSAPAAKGGLAGLLGAARGAGAAASAAAGAGAAASTPAQAPAAAAAPRSTGVSSSQLSVIVEHMRSQRAALRIVLEQLHSLRTDVQRITP